MYFVNYCIRKVDKKDLDRIYEIELKCFPRDAYPKSLLSYYLFLAGDTSFVIEVNGRVVGYIIVLIRWGNLGHILSLAIDPKYRGRGLGRLLLKEAIERIKREKEIKVFRLEVRASNVPAIRLYRSLGFRYSFFRPNYYQDGEGCYVMFLRTDF
ncbi:MAG: ribosomal-protein-alanine N-acetyltransferase [Thermoprotei archaeon]|nr:MAG: ribosomal-protein-alanine N-acetyltransferase [Thermoprotei archaeon]